MGGAKPGPTPRRAVSCNIVRSDANGQSCFGKLSRDTGHSRVPVPPDRITGTMLTADEAEGAVMGALGAGTKVWRHPYSRAAPLSSCRGVPTPA